MTAERRGTFREIDGLTVAFPDAQATWAAAARDVLLVWSDKQ